MNQLSMFTLAPSLEGVAAAALSATYSADLIATKGAVRKPLAFDSDLEDEEDSDLEDEEDSDLEDGAGDLEALPGMESVGVDRARAAAAAVAAALTIKLLQPLADVSAKSGEMERLSPLFFGTGDNPTLF